MIKQEYNHKNKTGVYIGGVVVGPVVTTGFAVVGIDVGPLVLALQ
jgi:hypothetical protein